MGRSPLRIPNAVASILASGFIVLSCGRIGYNELEFDEHTILSRDASTDASTEATRPRREGSVDARVDGTDSSSGTDSTSDGSACAGFAAEFDGTAYLTVPRPVQDDFTLEAWIKSTTSPPGSMFYHGNGIIYADALRGGTATGNDDFGSSTINGKFAFGVGHPDTTIQSVTSITTGKWVHVAATRRRSTGEFQVLVNGVVEVSAITGNMLPLDDQATLMLGNTNIDGHRYVGWMDEVRIWNVVRSEAEIAADMHRPIAGNEPGLVAYWKFDDPGGAVARDSSPSLASATVVGPLAWVPSDAPLCGNRDP